MLRSVDLDSNMEQGQEEQRLGEEPLSGQVASLSALYETMDLVALIKCVVPHGSMSIL